MKLNHNFIRHNIDDGQTVLVPTADANFHGVIQGNKSVDVILQCLESDSTEAQIVEAMCAQFDGDPALIEKDVADVLKQLRSVGAIDE